MSGLREGGTRERATDLPTMNYPIYVRLWSAGKWAHHSGTTVLVPPTTPWIVNFLDIIGRVPRCSSRVTAQTDVWTAVRLLGVAPRVMIGELLHATPLMVLGGEEALRFVQKHRATTTCYSFRLLPQLGASVARIAGNPGPAEAFVFCHGARLRGPPLSPRANSALPEGQRCRGQSTFPLHRE